MTKIPDDIMQAARDTCFRLFGHMAGDIKAHEIIARALMAERLAERERCAKVAKEERRNREGYEAAFERGACAASRNIERDIRGQS